ncbi:hypothetical protein HHI36_000912, partial [Cryptolaemus montrouzieri]
LNSCQRKDISIEAFTTTNLIPVDKRELHRNEKLLDKSMYGCISNVWKKEMVVLCHRSIVTEDENDILMKPSYNIEILDPLSWRLPNNNNELLGFLLRAVAFVEIRSVD